MVYTQILLLPGVAARGRLLLGCTTTANVDYREGYDFSSIHAIRLVPPAQPGTSDNRISSPLFEERIHKAITAHLVAHGFEIFDSNADAS